MRANQERRSRTRTPASETLPPPSWPGDPEDAAVADIDFEAVAHVLANTCRWGGRTRRFLSLAQHALTMAEEVEALDGIPAADRRALALHALLTQARAAWLGDHDGGPVSAKAAERARRHGERIDRALREAAGLEADPPEAWAEVLRFVARMTDAAERRDLGITAAGGAGAMFPPLRRRIRPMRPERAAGLWLSRLRELSASSGGTDDGSRSSEPGAADAGDPRVEASAAGAP